MIQRRSNWSKWIIWQTNFEFFCQKVYYIHCIWLQWNYTPFITNFCPSFECTVVFSFDNVYPCYLNNCLWIWKIDVLNETGSRFIRPTLEISVRVDVLLWFQEVCDIYWLFTEYFHDRCKLWLCCPKGKHYYCFPAFLLDFSYHCPNGTKRWEDKHIIPIYSKRI